MRSRRCVVTSTRRPLALERVTRGVAWGRGHGVAAKCAARFTVSVRTVKPGVRVQKRPPSPSAALPPETASSGWTRGLAATRETREDALPSSDFP